MHCRPFEGRHLVERQLLFLFWFSRTFLSSWNDFLSAFQSKFSSRTRSWSEAFVQEPNTFKIRFSKTEVSSHSTPASSRPDSLCGSTPPKQPTGSSQDCRSSRSEAMRVFPSIDSLHKSFDKIDADTLNLWKKCTSYSPKIKHMFPNWAKKYAEKDGEYREERSVPNSSAEAPDRGACSQPACAIVENSLGNDDSRYLRKKAGLAVIKSIDIFNGKTRDFFTFYFIFSVKYKW